MSALREDLDSQSGGFGRFFADRRCWLSVCVAGSVFRALLVIPTALAVRSLSSRLIEGGDRGQLLVLVTVMAGLQILAAALGLGIQLLSTWVTTHASARLRNELVHAAFDRSRDAVTNEDPSVVQSLVVTEVSRAASLSTAVVNGVLPSLVTIAAALVILIRVDPVLGAASLTAAPLAAGLNHWLRKSVQRTDRAARRDLWELHRRMRRLCDLWDLATAHGLERVEQASMADAIGHVGSSNQAAERAASVYQQVQGLTITAGGALVLAVGGIEVQRGALSLADFLAFFVVMSFAQGAARSLLGSLPSVVSGRQSLGVIYGWLDSVAPPLYSGTARPTIDGSVLLQGVHAGYRADEVLGGVDLAIESGEIVGISGPNGAGKSTIVSLLVGWYRPTAGRLSACGVDYDDLDLGHFRRSLAVVHQDPTLFSATVRENIAYGLDVDDEAIMEAAELAGAADMIASLASGLDSQIGDGGILLSGGQRQRIALARALVRRPRLLVLDEPTNHLDRAAVTALLANLRHLPERPTTLVVTHDREVLAAMDRVCHLVDGRLVNPSADAPVRSLVPVPCLRGGIA